MGGTVRIIVKYNKKRDETWASDIFPPFWDMLNFLEEVYLEKLPTEFELDVEGEIVKYKVDKINKNDLIEFIIYRGINEEYGHLTPKTYMRAELNRIDFLFLQKKRIFLHPLVNSLHHGTGSDNQGAVHQYHQLHAAHTDIREPGSHPAAFSCNSQHHKPELLASTLSQDQTQHSHTGGDIHFEPIGSHHPVLDSQPEPLQRR